jgi:hypothetical protein
MTGDAADGTLPLVRESVRKVLTRSSAFAALPPDERRQLAHDMVKVARYIVDAGGETAGVPMQARVATGLAATPPTPPLQNRKQEAITAAKAKKKQPGGFDATAATSGSTAFTDTIAGVDFPKFVGGLVEGVFNAIVSSSIRQMEAYSTMVANIAKSADQYMKDNVSTNQARDYLAEKYPEQLQVDATAKGGPQLIPRKGAAGAGSGHGGHGTSQSLGAGPPGMEMPDFMKDLGLPKPIQKLDAKTAEETLVPAARMRMAMDRQQLLATMVLMGINRLIVTDGRISASCLFQLDTTDSLYDDTTSATDFDEHASASERSWSFWFAPRSRSSASSNFKVSTTNNAGSEAEAKMHAELTGNVDINFRSETFPLEKMADILQIREIEQKAPAAAAAPLPPAPGPALPPPPPIPAFPSPFPPAGG